MNGREAQGSGGHLRAQGKHAQKIQDEQEQYGEKCGTHPFLAQRLRLPENFRKLQEAPAAQKKQDRLQDQSSGKTDIGREIIPCQKVVPEAQHIIQRRQKGQSASGGGKPPDIFPAPGQIGRAENQAVHVRFQDFRDFQQCIQIRV